MCGIFSPSFFGIRTICPSKIPSPFTPGLSSLASKSTCIPRQIPSRGICLLAASFNTSDSLNRSRFSMASPNDPTPGRMIRSAFRISSLFRVITGRSPDMSAPSPHFSYFPRHNRSMLSLLSTPYLFQFTTLVLKRNVKAGLARIFSDSAMHPEINKVCCKPQL